MEQLAGDELVEPPYQNLSAQQADALIATGHMWDVLDADTNLRLLNTRIMGDWRELINEFPPLALENVAFRNMGDGTFREVASAALETTGVDDTICCYAEKTETWVHAPDGNRWELSFAKGN